MDNRQELKSLKKALKALTAMNRMGDATVTDVAKSIGTPRTTAYRLLATLASEGYIEKQPHSDLYRLTSLVAQLASGFQEENLLLEVAKPLAEELGRRIGWSVSVATPRGAEMITRITTNHESALALDRCTIGLAIPIMHATTGLCYLAYCPPQERDVLVGLARRSRDPLQSLSHNRPKLDSVLKRIRERGFSNMEFSQYREGNIAVPLIHDGRPLGGLVMRYIKSAMTAEKLQKIFIPHLRDLAAAIEDECAARSGAVSDVPYFSPDRTMAAVAAGAC